ncbi:MAG TPA: phosphoribosylformylglycinamidine synthase subunit PurL [Dehalococcoidia bacterium]|nr:phosphoribosylformylglycinamidine synthase subunit PurL [Dehalococcoidia bacterium]
MHRVEVYVKEDLPDARGQGLARDIYDLGISDVSDVRVVDIYWLGADLKTDELELICRNLLADPVTHSYRYDTDSRHQSNDSLHSIEVAYNAGVADPVEETAMKALLDLGIDNVKAIKTAKCYLIKGGLNEEQLEKICSRLLVNPIIQHIVDEESIVFTESPQYTYQLEYVELLGADNHRGIAHRFGFSDNEIEAIAAYFTSQGRNPTDAELETLAQTWSEHCVHKTFKGKISFNGETIDNLLKSTVARATQELAKPWCLSVFKDNAGVIDFDGEWALCFKVETHNHPSAIEPYGGASTGIGGVVRDVLGTGSSAWPICNTDVFCFGQPDLSYDKLLPGVLHPRRMLKGVRAGVADYGNRLGIPTINGAILFDERYVANPLIYCGTVGLMPKDKAQMGQQLPGDLVVVAGGRTGRDGIHGVTFASEQLNKDSTELSFSSVQIGSPIVEKKLIDTLVQARDRNLFRRITDCGGGGLSSAVGEMAAETGVRVYLDRVPLKYAGLSYSEIWISESQERMLLAVPPECADELLKLFANEGTEATVIGEFTDDKKLKLFYNDNLVCNLEMDFLHKGLPQLEMEAEWQQPKHIEPDFTAPDLAESLLKILALWNVCSKEWVIRQYDHEVQGGSVLKPLVGRKSDGPGDAAIIRPILNSDRGIIISNGINPKYSDIDPYWMAASAIDEALRQIIAVGGNLKQVALLDNFCWGNTSRPERLGALVRACRACYDMAVVYGTPFISGKDSLNNEFEFEGKIISIPDTLLISAMGVIEDSNKVVSMDFKTAGNLIYIIGSTSNELGGSEYFSSLGFTGNSVPRLNPKQAKDLMDNLSLATEVGLVKACHDLSDGGLGVAIAEMAFAGGLGANIRLVDVPLGETIQRDDYILFSESNSRFLAEVSPQDKDGFEKAMGKSTFARIGEVTSFETLEIYGLKGDKVLDIPIDKLKEAWQKPLGW